MAGPPMSNCDGQGRAEAPQADQQITARTAPLSFQGYQRVTSESSSGLRLHVEQQIDEQPTLSPPQLTPLCRAFERTTGWQLRLEQAPMAPGEVWSTPIDAHGQ